MIALYHRIYKRENFEKAAKDLVALLNSAQKQAPNVPRTLYVDIEGHRNEAGGYDADMLELQTEFGLGFLLPFVTEVHFPLASVKNTKEQQNDIPQRLLIGNARDKRDQSLEELYIENFSNTEFMSEEDVYEYLEAVSNFLKEYNDFLSEKYEKEEYDSFGWLGMWRKHMNELFVELFNSFVLGNLLSVAAMTRTLMECYVYVSILKKEQSAELIDEWWLCNMIHKITAETKKSERKVFEKQKKKQVRNQPEKEPEGDNALIDALRNYCEGRGIDFQEKWTLYTKERTRDNGWLREVTGLNGVGFSALCDYIEEKEINGDYQNACAFVHGQDITTKLGPFTFYSSIYSRLFLMITYIFKSIRLYGVDEDLENEMEELEVWLMELGQQYL